MYSMFEHVLGTALCSIFGLTHDWGIAIVLFTVGVRCMLIPISVKMAKSGIAQAKVSAKMQHVKQSWTGSKSELMLAQQQLLKEHGVNPISSTLLPLVQAPIFFLLYRLFRYLNHPATSILIPWVPYLTAIDPFHIIPIVAAVLIAVGTLVTYSQSHVGNVQIVGAVVSFVMTLVILWGAPVAVALYYTTSGVWGTLERLFFRKIFLSKSHFAA